jgi:hypothetical protein
VIGLLFKLTGLALVLMFTDWQTAVGVLLMAVGHEIDGHVNLEKLKEPMR